METPHKLSRRELEQLLLSLQLLDENEAFVGFREEAQNLYDRALASILNDTPVDVKTFLVRERLIGAAQELKRFLDLISSTKEDLNQQLEQQKDA